MTAIGAVDLALWDIKGKTTGQPVYQLLGGAVRDRVLSYTHATGWDVPALLDSVDAARRARFPRRPRPVRRAGPGHRLRRDQAGVRTTSPPAGAPRRSRRSGTPAPTCATHPVCWPRSASTSGRSVALLHDVHHRLTPNQAARLGKALEPLDLFWLEDVTPAENQEVLRHVRAAHHGPAGHRRGVQHDLGVPAARHRAADRLRARGRDPRRRDQLTAPHRRARRGVADQGSARTARPTSRRSPSPRHSTSDCPRRTSRSRSTWATSRSSHEVFRHAWQYADGHLHPGDEPGLGVEVDEELAARFPYEPAYLPVARRRDGSMTDW